MSDKFLNRNDAPFTEKLWEKIDTAVVESARSQLTARRLLAIEGPYGLGLKFVPGPDFVVQEKLAVDGVSLQASGAIPVLAIASGFVLSPREIATFEETGLPLNLNAAASAAIACAQQEDHILFYGVKALGINGLLNSRGAQSASLCPWDKAGDAAEDLIKAVIQLDNSGFHGPYALALAPDRFNKLFRLYPQGTQTEMDHLKTFITKGIIKSPAITSGGVLIAAEMEFASIVIGQDLKTGFIGPSADGYEFNISESLALRLVHPGAVCVLAQE